MPNGGFVLQQISQVHTLEHVIDALLQQDPHWSNAALVRRGAPLRVDRVLLAVQIEGRQLGGVNDIPNRDLGRVSCQLVPTPGTSRADDDAGAPKAQQDLLDVVPRKLLRGRELTAGDRPLIGAPGEVQGANQAVLGPGGYSHTFTIGSQPLTDKSAAAAAAHKRVHGRWREA